MSDREREGEGKGERQGKRETEKQKTDRKIHSLAGYTIEGSRFILNICIDVRLQQHSQFLLFTKS